MKDLSLLVAYRDRPGHLKSLIDWFPKGQALTQGQLELVIAESSIEKTAWLQELDLPNVKHIHIQEDGPFNKSRILNTALAASEGTFVTSFDVDLVPYHLSFSLHLKLAQQSDLMLITGYRVDTDMETFESNELSLLQSRAAIAKEDLHEGWMRDQLLNNHRFGVLPFFKKDVLEDVNGWDKSFVGWGGEDQDMIHRYLGTERHLLKSPDLVYLHLKHAHAPDWNNGEMTKRNREILYNKFKLMPNIT